MWINKLWTAIINRRNALNSGNWAYLCATNRGVEQLVARWAHNPKVASSSLASATKKKKAWKFSGLFYAIDT